MYIIYNFCVFKVKKEILMFLKLIYINFLKNFINIYIIILKII